LSKKVFISYSHADETHKDALEEHLALLSREGVISVWDDRKLIAADDWKNQIDENLEAAQIIIFLISSSFLASPYCMDVEFERAREKHKEGTAKLVPIIVRAVNWTSSELGNVQALPKDAKPITSWKNKDEAWTDVVQGLSVLIKSFEPTVESLQQSFELVTTISINQPFQDWLESTDISFSHRSVSKVSLPDVFVWPDLKIDSNNTENIEIQNSRKVLVKKGLYLLSGEEQQGKTTLLKRLYVEFLKEEKVPVYLDSKNLKKTDVNLIIKAALNNQYENLDINSVEKENLILLVDNLDEHGLNLKGLNKLIDNMSVMSEHIILTTNDSYSFLSSEALQLSEYEVMDIQGLGFCKREEIAEKWISLGVEDTLPEKELYKRLEDISTYLNSIIRKNILPPKPVYILILMQMLETSEKQNLEMTSHGHCYQKLIYQDLEKAKVRSGDIEMYLNFLTELAWEIFNNEGSLNAHKQDEFFKKYKSIYIAAEPKDMIDNLSVVPLLSRIDNKLNFSYPYIYYFFTAKKIAESFHNDSNAKKSFQTLLTSYHREDYSNILVFITHHSKDSWVTDEINRVLKELFPEQKEATLTKDALSFMNEFVALIPELVLESKSVQGHREQRNIELDKAERNSQPEIPDGDEVPMDLFVSINKTFKGMDIAGQILKNRHATLTKPVLAELAENGTNTGLRFLDYFIEISGSAKSEIIKMLIGLLDESPHLSNVEMESHATKAYYHMVYGVINGVIKKIASSIGSKEAFIIYEELEKQIQSPAVTLIKQAIDLQFNRIINFDELEKTTFKLRNNAVCLHMLKNIVFQHSYMFSTDIREKQKIENLFGISVKKQLLLDKKKIGKT
jgi:hypothetical protein